MVVTITESGVTIEFGERNGSSTLILRTYCSYVERHYRVRNGSVFSVEKLMKYKFYYNYFLFYLKIWVKYKWTFCILEKTKFTKLSISYWRHWFWIAWVQRNIDYAITWLYHYSFQFTWDVSSWNKTGWWSFFRQFLLNRGKIVLLLAWPYRWCTFVDTVRSKHTIGQPWVTLSTLHVIYKAICGQLLLPEPEKLRFIAYGAF